MTRPSMENIRKAFGEHLTVSVEGFEQTVWDIMMWGGTDLAIDFLQEYALPQESVGVHADYAHMNQVRLEESIKEESK
jgi:hypothetical protein